MARKPKDDRIQFRIKGDLKTRYFAACGFRDNDPSEELRKHIVAFTREAEKEMRERGIIKDPAE